MRRRIYIMMALPLLLLVALGAYVASAQTATPVPAATTPAPAGSTTGTVTATEELTATAVTTPTLEELRGEIPFSDAWANSAHARYPDEAFRHWDAEGEVPASCAKCHSTPGYQDYLGADGTAFRSVENPAPTNTVVACMACHNQVAANLDSVLFPSGAELDDLGPSARCMECHQGRASTVQVNQALARAGVVTSTVEIATTDTLTDTDTPVPSLSFVNIHYYAAAATLFGSEASGGYEYDGMRYQPKFAHVEGYDSCIGCHMPHSLQIRLEECATCHQGVETTEDLRDIRMAGSLADYDGDGDLEEGIYYEIEGLQEMLLQSIQAYAAEVAGTPIGYNAHVHPYFFIDTDESGEIEEAEAVSANRYNAFTGRLLTAAYNYQVSVKDPGMFAHNAKYIIELLHDSIAVLNEALAEPADLSGAVRDDPGHFQAVAEAFRHWDAEGEVPAGCVKCHQAGGLPFFLQHGVTIAMEPSDSLKCGTCHTNFEDFTLFAVEEVVFPSGATLAFEDNPASNLCLQCHQGRESTLSVNAAIARAGVADDEVSEQLNFRNPHYFAAGATLFGAEASGAYQYEGMEYAGRFAHVPNFDSCAECHNPHQLTVSVNTCSGCHAGITELTDIRFPQGQPVDYDGDGNTDEGIAGEVATMHDALLAAIQQYTAETTGTAIAYAAANYPYWFIDTNENGEADPDEISNNNRYAEWTPTLLRAAYNYQWVAKDPGAFAHNNEYIMQVLYDSLQAIGGDEAVADMTRP